MQPTRVFWCNACGESEVTLRPGESWWDYCRNERPMPAMLIRKWGERPYVCGLALFRIRRRARLAQLVPVPSSG